MHRKLFSADVYSSDKEEYARVTAFAEDGSQTTKTVAYDDFVRSVASGIRTDGIKIGPLPQGTLSMWIDNNSRKIAVFLKQEQRMLTLSERGKEKKSFMVPFPALAVQMTVYADKTVPNRCFALASDEWPDENTRLFRFPFGNVSTDGSICMGGNISITEGKSLSQAVQEALTMFLYSPYNGDYYGVNCMVSSGESLEDLLKRLNGKKEFPKELLKETEYTLRALV